MRRFSFEMVTLQVFLRLNLHFSLIVNMLGVEVARLFSGELGAGEHSFLWGNPMELTDGVYECLVRMNGQVETVPVVKF